MIFKIHKDNIEDYTDWLNDHKEVCHVYGHTTIGGALTYSFTPTGLGMITKVSCGCGKY
jgi:hypothetical protein